MRVDNGSRNPKIATLIQGQTQKWINILSRPRTLMLVRMVRETKVHEEREKWRGEREEIL
jgi:hypothetical protein